MKEIVHPGIYFRTAIALLALLALTWAIGYVNLGRFNLIIALGIAMAKALLIVLFFMHLKRSSRLLRLAAAAGLIWLLILLSLTLSDYISRKPVFNPVTSAQTVTNDRESEATQGGANKYDAQHPPATRPTAGVNQGN